MDLSVDSTLNKLILLFVFDKMDFPILEENLLNITGHSNSWVPWMECKETIGLLMESGFIHQSFHEKKVFYSITPDGRQCLSHFYMRIPANTREEITEFIKENRMNFRRRQEYFRTYSKNDDGTFTVHLKIIDPAKTLLELKIIVSNRQTAKAVYNKWEEKAGQIYYLLHEQLID